MRLWKQPSAVWILGAVVAVAAASAEAQSQNQPPPQPEAPPAQGEVVDDINVTNADLDIAPAPPMQAQEERNAPGFNPAAAPEATMAAPQDAFSDRIANLWRCKYQVAMEQRKPPTDVTAGRALIRFEITAAGKPISPTVVALEPASPDVLTCVSRDIQNWQLSPAPGQVMKFEAEVDLSAPAASPQ